MEVRIASWRTSDVSPLRVNAGFEVFGVQEKLVGCIRTSYQFPLQFRSGLGYGNGDAMGRDSRRNGVGLSQVLDRSRRGDVLESRQAVC